MTSAPPGFEVAYPSRTVIVPNAGQSAADAVERMGAQRVGVVTARSLRYHPVLKVLLQRLGSHHCTIFGRVQPHTPRPVVLDAARAFRRGDCDVLVSVGGGSAVDTAKGAALVLATSISEADDFDAYRSTLSADGILQSITLDARRVLPHIAIPTTLSGAAHTHSAGISDDRRGEKLLHVHPGLGPCVVLLDPELAAGTPDDLWSATGMKAFEHAVEGLYSRELPALAAPLRWHAFAVLASDLAPSVTRGRDLHKDRTARLLAAAAMAVFAWPSGPLGVSHALGHQAGIHWGLSHGQSAAIFLPHALRFNASSAPAILDEMAAKLGASGGDSTTAVLDHVSTMAEALELPLRLRDVGVPERAAFPDVAAAALDDPILHGNPRPITHRDVLELLQAAY